MKIMCQAAPQHFHHVGRPGDMNPKIWRVQLMHDLLEALDRLFRMLAFHENDHVAGLPIGRYQQPAPKRAFDSVVKTFWSFGEALDRVNPADGLGVLRESLDSTQIS